MFGVVPLALTTSRKCFPRGRSVLEKKGTKNCLVPAREAGRVYESMHWPSME